MPTVELTLENDCGALIGKGQNKNVTSDININNNISAPIKQGEKLRRSKILYRRKFNSNK